MPKSITAFAPASVANVGPGFDIMGFALKEPGDRVTISEGNSKGVRISKISSPFGMLTLNPSKNTAGAAILAMMKALEVKVDIDIAIKKGLPLASGLGSSAASAVAAVVAFNAYLGEPFTLAELLPFALAGEKVASGAVHADNVAASLLGGFILIQSYDPLNVVELPYPSALRYVVAVPDMKLETMKMRKSLPKKISLEVAMAQAGNVAGMISGLLGNSTHLIANSMHDLIVEPHRAKFIPYYYDIKALALEAGAIGFNISGSGPSMFALCDSAKSEQSVLKAFKSAAKKVKVKVQFYSGGISPKGARIV